MKYNIYAVRDVHNGFGAPILDSNDQSAIRGFAYGMHNTNPIMGYAPKDFDFYCIGEFDVNTGVINAFDIPHLVISGSDAFNM